MPSTKPKPEHINHTELPCADSIEFKDIERCMSRCMNCRRDVEGSLTRIAGRKIRRLRLCDECSAVRCAEFLKTITDDSIRMHLASMAWWRFSADTNGGAEPIRRVMLGCRATVPDTGMDYVHKILRVLSRLSDIQLTAWFGCDNLYQIVSLFYGDRPSIVGPHCAKCRLYKQGCTEYNALAATTCPFWADDYIQRVAAAVKKSGEWRDPCKGIKDITGG